MSFYKDFYEPQPPKEPKKQSRPLFTRGYKESREKLNKNSHYSRSCFNCYHYFQASGDKEEICQNPNVLKYDMVITESSIYCLKWEPSSSNKDSMFKKGGRARLD